jgi:putative pyrroloquinoline-quinone binding quinoprotein
MFKYNQQKTLLHVQQVGGKNSWCRWILVIGLGIILEGVYLPVSLCMARDTHSDWAVYEGDAGASHYSALTKINRSNIKKLRIAWTYTIGDNNAEGMTPLVVNGTMYVIGGKGAVVAIDAATGRQLWKYPFKGATYQLDRGLLYWERKDSKDRRIFVARKKLTLFGRNLIFAVQQICPIHQISALRRSCLKRSKMPYGASLT